MNVLLHLCADVGSDSKPFVDNGYTVIKVGIDIGVENYTPPANVFGVIANPPCTEFSTARADGKARNPDEGMFLVEHCLRIIKECNPKFWVIENPNSGYLKRFLGKPALVFQPYEYGDPYTKKTALWGMFNEPVKNIVEPKRGTMVKYASDFKDIKPVDKVYRDKLGTDSRTIRRSITPNGFAKQFYEANK